MHITYDAFKDYTKFVYETADDSIGGLSVELTCPGCRDQCRPLAVVLAYLRFGDNENALLWLDRAVDHQEKGLMIFAVPVASPILDPLRRDPRFQHVIDKMGLTEYARKNPRKTQ